VSKPLDPNYVTGFYRKSFGDQPTVTHKFQPNMTLADMVESFYTLPPDFPQRGIITIGGHEIKRKHWQRVKVKAGQPAVFHYPLAGGASGGAQNKSKGVLGLVIGIASILTAGFAALGGFGALLGSGAGGLFSAGTLSARLLTAGITIAGQLAMKALSAPPVAPTPDTSTTPGPASLSGNLLQTGSPIARVIGTRKVFPSLVTQPFTYRIGQDEYVEAVFALAGPHLDQNIKIGDTLITDSYDVQYQVRSGWDDDTPLDLVSSYAVTKQPGIELTAQVVDPDFQDTLLDQGNPQTNLQQPIAQGSSNAPDRILIDLSMPEGLYDHSDATRRMSIPFRVSIKNTVTGITYNLPEMHYSSILAREVRPTIELNWRPQTVPIPVSMQASEGWTCILTTVPAQPIPPSGGWQADASFYSGSGPTYLVNGIEGATGVNRCYADGSKCYVELDVNVIPKGRYQVQVIRGCAIQQSNFSNNDSYTYGGSGVIDFFGFILSGSTAKIIENRQNLSDRVGWVRLSSVYNQHPINGGKVGSGLFLIAVVAKNRAVDNLSLLASGYVYDWDGTGWNTLTTSSNPATNYYQVLRGPLSPDPLDAILVDNASLVTWRQACIDNSYTCDMVCQGDQLQSVLSRIAGCGYAQPRQSETWGVIRDYDRSAEDPDQIFSSRNSFDIAMTNSFTRLPDAFVATWLNAIEDDAPEEVIVYRPGYENTINPRLETINYDGISTQAQAVARATFDLMQASLRSAEYRFNAQAEAIRSTRGSLIAVNHDFLSDLNASARIEDVEIIGTNITAITVDAQMPVFIEPDMLAMADMLAVADMLHVGSLTSVTIRRADGLISTHSVTGATGSRKRLEFTTPFNADLDANSDPLVRYGNLVCVGQSGSEYMRLIITSITYDVNMTATITAVAEAPQLWA
jgi:hypothetical protein